MKDNYNGIQLVFWFTINLTPIMVLMFFNKEYFPWAYYFLFQILLFIATIKLSPFQFNFKQTDE